MTFKTEVQELVDNYWKWMRDKTILKEVDNDWVELNTPILDRHNDGLQLYIRRVDDGYLISDDGYILSDLILSGVNIDTPKRSKIIDEILVSHNVTRHDDSLVIKTSAEDYPSRKNDLIRTMLEISGLHVTTSGRSLSYFLEDVSEWLDSKGIRGTKHTRISGMSGVSYNIDFLIPGESMNSPFTAYQTLSRPDKQSLATRIIMPMGDIRKVRDADFVAVLNDTDMKESIVEDLISITESYDITPIRWTQRDEMLKA